MSRVFQAQLTCSSEVLLPKSSADEGLSPCLLVPHSNDEIIFIEVLWKFRRNGKEYVLLNILLLLVYVAYRL